MPKKIIISSEFEIYNSINELNASDKKLLKQAIKAAERAYAPYSNFYVGAAVLLANGTIVTGNNQENAAYPSGLCAERVAIFHAASQFPKTKIIAIAISAKSMHKTLKSALSPCGACRQAMSEYESKFNSPIKLIMGGSKKEIYVSRSVANLLPLAFTNKSL